MKKLAVSAVIIGVFIIYALAHARASVGFTPSQGSTGSPPTRRLIRLWLFQRLRLLHQSAGRDASDNGQFKNGSYTGAAADAQWGNVQVKITIQNGRLTNVQFLQYPNHRDRSVEINNYAMPQLTSEAISGAERAGGRHLRRDRHERGVHAVPRRRALAGVLTSLRKERA